MKEGEENQAKVTEDTFKNITGGNSPDIKTKMPISVQEAYRTPNKMDQKRNSPCELIIKLVNI